jgi:uncharacterized protein with HEPN domain
MMAGTRDKLIHEYFGVNFDILWQAVKAGCARIKTSDSGTHGEAGSRIGQLNG